VTCAFHPGSVHRKAATSGAQLIQLGEANVVLTGGVENMRQAPHVLRGLRTGLRLGDATLEDSLWKGLGDSYCDYTMAMTAENVATNYGAPASAAVRGSPRSWKPSEC
jgi:acetyl-CoA acetyltransferase